MGFGILLMGFLLSMSNYPGYTDCAAFFVIFYSLLKLGEYSKLFKTAKFVAFVTFVCGMAGMMLSMGELIGFVDETNTLVDIYDNASEVLKVIFGVFMLLGIMDISRQTSLDSNVTLGARCLVILGLYVVLYVISFFFQIFVPWRMLMRVIYMLASGYLIFCCYRWICLEGDEENSPYTSRFELVNRLRRRLDEKAEEGNRKGAQVEEFKRRQAEARKNGVDVTRRFSESKKRK
jgi:hypothetical protein